MTTFAVVDLGYGDAGKGTVVDWLSRCHAGAVNVRFNGGPQAAHNVVTPDGRHHTFAQFGSGMFEPDTITYLSRHMLVDPLNMGTEADVLASVGVGDAYQRTWVDPDCRVVTPYHRAMNRLRELSRGQNRHGTCGLGIGECVQDSIRNADEILRVSDLTDETLTGEKLAALRGRMVRELMLIDDEPVGPQADRERAVLVADVRARINAIAAVYVQWADSIHVGKPDPYGRPLIFEGAQGVLIDETHGFHPHTTWSNCTFDNAASALTDLDPHRGPLIRIGVTRSYMVRHGDGPFPTEHHSGVSPDVPELHNGTGGWQGAWRQGRLDVTALRYAVEACGGVDGLAVTHLDSIGPGRHVSRNYSLDGDLTDQLDPQQIWKYSPGELEYVQAAALPGWLGDQLDVPPMIVSRGPTADDKLGL